MQTTLALCRDAQYSKKMGIFSSWRQALWMLLLACSIRSFRQDWRNRTCLASRQQRHIFSGLFKALDECLQQLRVAFDDLYFPLRQLLRQIRPA